MSELIQKERGAHADNYYPRIDGEERVTGSAKYGGDWRVPGMLYGRIVKSKVPHGIVKSIDYESASEIPGVSAIITCLDDRTIWFAGEREHPRRVFADRVRYIGDCVAAVAAETRSAARGLGCPGDRVRGTPSRVHRGGIQTEGAPRYGMTVT